ncbi:GntR family transcriptional regulator [Desulfitobacterium sp.]|uniref:GntR family transcriptional regulator n=1 Tax=Desulfitobacterium sp. TaxID=49981 RepID=UPI002B2086C3|nr:GntR family transcriptional regulator [Desulfitobacterium sp.]MEA4900677.1 GntR family transcriptional regulator [Desulfitobacterium sp.]
MSLNKDTHIPLHYQLTNVLREGIKAEKWGVGELFPTDKELMGKYEISSTTVRRAVAELVQEGWLERKPGKGTFVKKAAIEETLGALTGFFDEMIIHGYDPCAEVLNVSEVKLSASELEKVPQLRIFSDQNESMFLIEKIQKLNNEPIAYVRSFWPYEYGVQIAEFDLMKRGIYDIIKNELNLCLIRAEQFVGADIARKKVAQHLNVKVGFPVLTMERIAYDEQNRPIELSINEYRADRYKYKVLLEKSDQNVAGYYLAGNPSP